MGFRQIGQMGFLSSMIRDVHRLQMVLCPHGASTVFFRSLKQIAQGEMLLDDLFFLGFAGSATANSAKAGRLLVGSSLSSIRFSSSDSISGFFSQQASVEFLS